MTEEKKRKRLQAGKPIKRQEKFSLKREKKKILDINEKRHQWFDEPEGEEALFGNLPSQNLSSRLFQRSAV